MNLPSCTLRTRSLRQCGFVTKQLLPKLCHPCVTCLLVSTVQNGRSLLQFYFWDAGVKLTAGPETTHVRPLSALSPEAAAQRQLSLSPPTARCQSLALFRPTYPPPPRPMTPVPSARAQHLTRQQCPCLSPTTSQVTRPAAQRIVGTHCGRLPAGPSTFVVRDIT